MLRNPSIDLELKICIIQIKRTNKSTRNDIYIYHPSLLHRGKETSPVFRAGQA